MKNELSTIIYKPNWKYLIENCLKKELWEKTWVVFEYDEVKATMYLDSIDVCSKRAVFYVTLKGHYAIQTRIPLSKEHYNEIVFNNSLYNSISSLLVNAEKKVIEGFEVYQEAEHLDLEFEKESICRAEDYIEKLTDDERFREVFIDSFRDSLDTYKNRNEVLDMFRNKVKTNRQLMLATLYGQEEHYQRYLKFLIDDEEKENIIAELQGELENIDIKEMVDEVLEDFKENK